MTRLRLIKGGSTEEQLAERRKAGLRKESEKALRAMGEVVIALRVLGRHEEADELLRIRDAWFRQSAKAVEATR